MYPRRMHCATGGSGAVGVTRRTWLLLVPAVLVQVLVPVLVPVVSVEVVHWHKSPVSISPPAPHLTRGIRSDLSRPLRMTDSAVLTRCVATDSGAEQQLGLILDAVELGLDLIRRGRHLAQGERGGENLDEEGVHWGGVTGR